MTEYMRVLVCAGIVPCVLSFWRPLRFWRHLRSLACTIALIVFFFGSWDIFATYRGHWYFNAAAVSPQKVVNLPLEEALFFVVIPFCCIFTWEALRYLKKRPA